MLFGVVSSALQTFGGAASPNETVSRSRKGEVFDDPSGSPPGRGCGDKGRAAGRCVRTGFAAASYRSLPELR